MADKQELIVNLLKERLAEAKIGIIVKGIGDIDPVRISESVAESAEKRLYVAAVGYDGIHVGEKENYTLSDSIEKAVLWRSMPECAGQIIAFISNDTDKLHSLAEFDIISLRDLSKYLIGIQLKSDNNTPTHNFWTALADASDYFSFDAVNDFVSAVLKTGERSKAIPVNMWRLNLLCDQDILSVKMKPEERLRKNRELILAIGQFNEDSRKKFSRSLSQTNEKNQERLQKAYRALQNFYKKAEKEILKELDYATVQELFSESRKKEGPKKEPDKDKQPGPSAPIRPNELNRLISEVVVSGNQEDLDKMKELLTALKKRYDADIDPVDLPPIDDRPVELPKNQSDLRKLVGRVCNSDTWGALIKTEETVLKDAISADIQQQYPFCPQDRESLVSFPRGIDGNQDLFGFLAQFDAQFAEKHIETAEPFQPIITNLTELRSKLCQELDMIMYHPVLLFGVHLESRNLLIQYIQAWENLYHAFHVNEPAMRQISTAGASFAALALLLLDVLYFKTPKEWKAVLLPLHPIYLWRYYEVFRSLPGKKDAMSDEDRKALTEVLAKLPQVLNFVIANKLVSGAMNEGDEKVLPCSGSIEMLPTFENKTNRYLGDDGTEAIGEILPRWLGFAPYTKNEVRICSVDAPELIGILRQIKDFMDKNGCNRVVYDVYLTRDQNGNTDLSKLDYSGQDYKIGEYLKSGKIAVSIKNVSSARAVKQELERKPVHIAFYFDQSAYAIEFGPNSQNLYINPLVITYDYDFDDMQQRGSLFPSSEMDSGLIGDYHKLMKSADVISNNMNPRTTYNSSADMTDVVSTVRDMQAQWLVVADRDTNNYQPENAIPIGERQYDKRRVNVWASGSSRIISQYITLLRGYNLYPQKNTLVQLLTRFGHIAGNGLISIPRFGSDTQAIENKKKGLIGTLFAASWYTGQHEDSLVASLDTEKARLWLQNSRESNERADLVGLYYEEDKNTLHVQPIEVKTRDDSADYHISKKAEGKNSCPITGHAPNQVASSVERLQEIFNADEDVTDMFISARREVLKYQIVSECFRNVHDAHWQKKWCAILKKAFGNGKSGNIQIEVSGIILHIKLNETSGGEHVPCHHPDFDDMPIDFWKLTSSDIQRDVFGDDTVLKTPVTIDFEEGDETSVSPSNEQAGKTTEEFEDAPAENAHDGTASETAKPKTEAEPLQTGIHATPVSNRTGVTAEEIAQLVKDFKRSCNNYHVNLKECFAENAVVGPGVIRIKFRLAGGQTRQGLTNHLEDIGREMKRSNLIVQPVHNSDELLLDVPRLQKEKVLFHDVIDKILVTSPEQLYVPVGRTPDGRDLIEDLGLMPHMLVGGSTGSGKSVFLFTMLATFLKTHPRKEDMQLVLSSSKLEDFIHFEGLPHLFSGRVISDAAETSEVIKNVIFEESKRREKLLAEAKVANIIEYNKRTTQKLEPIVVVIDEFADLADQMETKKERDAFFKPVQQIAQTGRSRGIHLVVCTQRPEAKLVPPTTKAQLNGRVALRVNDGISSRMIIEIPDAQYLQKHGDMIYRNGDTLERVQGYLIEVSELDEIVRHVKNQR